MKYAITYFSSPLGLLRITGMKRALMKIEFVQIAQQDAHDESDLQEAVQQLDEYFAGVRTTFSIPLHPEGTHFQLNVWEQLQQIPFGKTVSYEDIARKLGDIKVIRAAATANGRNPLPIIIPCHRVIGKDGSLTGYSGGLWRKKWLLDFEMREIQPRLL
ncbi:MAG: methylated-DNA--[protein]-cysteine S-methyltransferase [Flavobacteriales bacterium]|nr:methylated-DNA--[protein]-cysteine S-methyltransferase [Flavobacteriales bacterium]